MICWIFFDVGNVIFNDDLAMAFIYEALYEEIHKIDSSVTFMELLSERERLIIEDNDGGHHGTLGRRYLGERRWHNLRMRIIEELERNYEHYHLPIPGIKETLCDLSGKYKLGIAANQVFACRTALDKHGLLEYFSILWLSSEIGLSKPNVRFFQTLIQQAKCLANETVMIGDRIDYDILPANKIGMKTMWAKLDFDRKAYIPDTEYRRLYFTSQNRVRVSRVEPRTEVERPNLTVTSLDEIPNAVERLCLKS